MNVMVRGSGDVSGQAVASASRDVAGRRPGDVGLRRRLAELGFITGLRFSLGQGDAR
jgi:Fe2+ transport system protein FeoA